MHNSDKRTFRQHCKELRQALALEERETIDATIARQVLSLGAWKRASMVYSYLSFGAEVDTRSLLQAAWDAGKVVALPRCTRGSRHMQWYAVRTLDNLEKSPLGVEEPVPSLCDDVAATGTPDAVALVPGLAFDEHGYRLGYGGGYYDTFLPEFVGTSIGLCRSNTLFDALPLLEAHDAPVDLVVTESGHPY